jgi:hypothetical protein
MEAAYLRLTSAVPDLVQAAKLQDAAVWAPWVSESEAERLPSAVNKLSLLQV